MLIRGYLKVWNITVKKLVVEIAELLTWGGWLLIWNILSISKMGNTRLHFKKGGWNPCPVSLVTIVRKLMRCHLKKKGRGVNKHDVMAKSPNAFCKGKPCIMTTFEIFEELTSKWMRENLLNFQKVLNKREIVCRQRCTVAYRRIVITCILNYLSVSLYSSQFYGISSSLVSSSQKVDRQQLPTPRNHCNREKKQYRSLLFPCLNLCFIYAWNTMPFWFSLS